MAADPASAAAVLAQVNAASDDMADLGLEDMQDPVDDDEEYIDETSGKKKQRSWLGKIGKGISKRVNKATAVITGGVMTAEDNEALARVNACRHPFALKEGGIGIQDPNEAKLCRSVLSMMIKSMGRTLLQGGNVMKTSFPIQCCQPGTILEVACKQAGNFHHFLPRAVACTDPVERMKLVVACFASSQILPVGTFLKPLNPILGETLQVEYSDGSKAYCEQTCHHPPITSFKLDSPPGAGYEFWGFTEFGAGFGYNRMFLKSKGLLQLKFKDGTLFEIGLSENKVENVFWGTMRHEIYGSQTFVDTTNNMRAVINYSPSGRVGLPSDYFEGVLEKFDPAAPDREGQLISNITGSWVGFCDFDKVRYWDINTVEKLAMKVPTSILKSDSRCRGDRNAVSLSLSLSLPLALARALSLSLSRSLALSLFSHSFSLSLGWGGGAT